ncbi:MAG: SPFH domain-containing protein [Phycisphaerae bacterium]
MRKVTIGTIVAVVVVVLFCELCTVVAKPYQKILLDRFGEIISHPTRICYNWFLCYPTDRVIRLDMRLHLYQSDNREVSTSAGEPISIRTFALWKIVNPVLYVDRLPGGTPAVQRYLDNKIQSAVLKQIGHYTLDEMFNVDAKKLKMQQAEQNIRQKVNLGMQALGIDVVKVGFARMTFPPDVAQRVYQRMTAERNKIASEYINQGEKQAQITIAQGRETATEIRSAAEKQAAIIRGQADASAYAILNSVQETPQARQFYRFWKSLQLFQNSMGNSTYWVLTPNNPVTEPLFDQMKLVEGKKSGTPIKVDPPAAK